MTVGRATQIAFALPLGLIGCFATLAGCAVEANYGGSHYACGPEPVRCPGLLVCIEGYCELPGTGTNSVDDAGPEPPPLGDPDASVPLPPPDAQVPPPPDGGPGTVDLVFTLGERPGAARQNVTNDTHVQLQNPLVNFINSPDVSVDADPSSVGLIRFDATGLPPGQIVSATLNLVWFDPLEDGTIEFYPVLESWDKSEVTWLERSPGVLWKSPGVGGGSRSATSVASSAPRNPTAYAVSLPPTLITSWRDLPAQNFGLAMVSTSTTGRGGQFRSKNYDTTPSERPLLTVTVRTTAPM
jgi:hypothetical protein